MIKIESTLNPAIFKSPTTGKTFVVSGAQPWIEVSPETTLDDIKWIPTYKPEKALVNVQEETFEVEGSKDNKYIVKRATNGTWNCTCVGFSFRRKCRHITNCKLIMISIEDN